MARAPHVTGTAELWRQTDTNGAAALERMTLTWGGAGSPLRRQASCYPEGFRKGSRRSAPKTREPSPTLGGPFDASYSCDVLNNENGNHNLEKKYSRPSSRHECLSLTAGSIMWVVNHKLYLFNGSYDAQTRIHDFQYLISLSLLKKTVMRAHMPGLWHSSHEVGRPLLA